MNKFVFLEVPEARARNHLLEHQLLVRKYSRFQEAYKDNQLIAVVFWEKNEPHVEHLTNNPRTVFESTIEFVNRHSCVIRTVRHRNLFDRVCERTKLKCIGKSLDKFGRGVEYIYEVKNANQ